MQLLLVALTLDGPDWTGLDWALPRLRAPQGLEGSTHLGSGVDQQRY